MIHAGGQIPGQILKTCAKVNSSMKEMLYEVRYLNRVKIRIPLSHLNFSGS